MKVKMYVYYSSGTNLDNCYSVIEKDTWEDAKNELVRVCGNSYCFSFLSPREGIDKNAVLVEKDNMTLVPLQPEISL